MNSTEKIAKVIATCFVEREVRKSEAWYEHGQNLGSPESVLEMIKFIVKKEQEVDAGAPMDTIIVNNDSGYESGKNYLTEKTGAEVLVLTMQHLKNIRMSMSIGFLARMICIFLKMVTQGLIWSSLIGMTMLHS